MAARQFAGLGHELDADDRPVLSRHAAERYDERTPADAVAPETALREAGPDAAIVDHDHFDAGGQPDLDRVHCYRGAGWTVVFLEVGGCAVTCWTTADCRDRALAAYLDVRAERGPR